MAKTGFYWDEKCFWHAGGNYAGTMALDTFVQPLAAGGLPENPETKRRLKNLMDVTGLLDELRVSSAQPAGRADLERVHPPAFLDEFKRLSDAGGGELGLRTPFARGGYEIAALSAGLAKQALLDVLSGKIANAYSLSRPPGHHCLPDWPNGFCLLANIAIAIEAAQAENPDLRFVVLDWDVHHGNGTEAIYYARNDVLTISLHQEKNYPLDTGDLADRGKGPGLGYNINLPLPPGSGNAVYLHAMERIVLPAIQAFNPDAIIIACGFDASPFDPLAHMLLSAEGFRAMTQQVKEAAESLCSGRLLMVHEGGYSETYVPFCGHAVIAEMAGSTSNAPDPLALQVATRQPNARVEAFQKSLVDEMSASLAQTPG